MMRGMHALLLPIGLIEFMSKRLLVVFSALLALLSVVLYSAVGRSTNSVHTVAAAEGRPLVARSGVAVVDSSSPVESGEASTEEVAGVKGSDRSTSHDWKVASSLNWKMRAGSLGDQVSRATASADGEMALDLALKILECESLMRSHFRGSSPGDARGAAPDVQRVRVERIQDEQRIVADCQTIPGDLKEARNRLLEVAADRKIVGAASELFALGSRRVEVLKQLCSDARGGHLQSLVFASGNDHLLLQMTKEEQLALRYGLYVAANHAEVGRRVLPYLETAQALARALADGGANKFDFSQMRDETRASGEEVARRLLDRMK